MRNLPPASRTAAGSECVMALTTVSGREEADRLAGALVEERLAACVNVIAPIASVYRWRGAVEREEEALLLMKTTEAGLDALRERLLGLHPYDVPEFLFFRVAGGAPAYLAWVAGAVG